MKTSIALMLAALTAAGCSTTKDTTTASTPDPSASFDAPRVTAAGTSPINPSMQTEFCQDQVADMYGAKRQNATTGERVVAADGGTTIDVTVDKGNGSVKTFKCRLDADNRFIDVVASDATL